MADKRHLERSVEEEQLLLRKYFDGSATPEEAHLLERRALDDPMLAEAMDGFEAHGYPEEAILATRQHLRDNYGDHRSNKGRWAIGTLVLVAAVFWYALVRDAGSEENTAASTTVIVEGDGRVKEEPPLPSTKHVIEQSATDSSMSFTISEPQAEEAKPEPAEHYYTREEAPETLPMIEPVANDSASETKKRTIKLPGAAIYHVFDYKVVDYRKIRIATWTSDQLLGGTSAAQQSAQDRPLLLETDKQVTYVDYLKETMALFATEHYKKADRRFIEILRRFEDDANALFYGGMASLAQKDYGTAVDRFKRSLNLPINTFHEESRFYLAMALKGQGDLDEANALFEEIAEEGGFYAQRAAAILNN